MVAECQDELDGYNIDLIYRIGPLKIKINMYNVYIDIILFSMYTLLLRVYLIIICIPCISNSE